jgi:hypothetical protein
MILPFFAKIFFKKLFWELNPNRVGFEGRVCILKLSQFQGKFKKMKKRGFNVNLPFYSFFFLNLEQRIGSTPIQTCHIEDFLFFQIFNYT